MRCSKQIHNNFIYFRYKCDPSFNYIKFYKCYKKDNPHNYVKSRVFCYGKKGKGGLVIVEGTRKSRDNLHQSCGGSSSQQILAIRNPNFPTRVPQHDARVNRRLTIKTSMKMEMVIELKVIKCLSFLVRLNL